jgi:hypothetical protein
MQKMPAFFERKCPHFEFSATKNAFFETCGQTFEPQPKRCVFGFQNVSNTQMHEVPIKQDTAMAHAYLITNMHNSIEELEKEQGQRPQNVFLGLPRDAKCAVLKHTAARFEVTCRTRVGPEAWS